MNCQFPCWYLEALTANPVFQEFLEVVVMRVELKYSKLRMLQSDFLHKDFNKKCERNNSGLRNLFTLLTKPVKITQLAIVKGTYLIFQAWPMNLCSSTTILLPQKMFKLSSLDSRWMWYCLIFTELVLWDFPFAIAVNPPGLVNIKRKEMRTVILLQRQAGHPREFKVYNDSSQWGETEEV